MTARRLSDDEIAHYRDHGYVVVHDLFPDSALRAIDAALSDLLDRARGLGASDAVFDLEASHRPDRPRVRRVKQPHQHLPAVDALLRGESLIALMRQLLGPDIRIQSSKLNMKSAGYGAPVEWHQDWAFYPHTNGDVLAVGLMLDDMTEDNGPLMVLPGSHKGPLHDHHDGGCFRGAVDIEREGVDLSGAVRLLGRRGSISIHHAMLMHGSDLNRSGADRRLMLFELMAADAWPLLGTSTKFSDFAEFQSRMVAGAQTLTPRMEPMPVRIPQPLPQTQGSIYEVQSGLGRRHFATHAEAAAEAG